MRDQFDADRPQVRSAACRLGRVGDGSNTIDRRTELPSLDTKAKSGRALLLSIPRTTHQIWLILLLIAVGYLLTTIFISSRQRNNANATSSTRRRILPAVHTQQPNHHRALCAYTVAMISGTTYLYKDMLGWYPERDEGPFS